jgi:hypothetical protein
VKLNSRELATILAALRYWQRAPMLGALADIATNDGEYEALSPDEIDELCEKINCVGDA